MYTRLRTLQGHKRRSVTGKNAHMTGCLTQKEPGSGSQASTMFRGPGAGLAPARPRPLWSADAGTVTIPRRTGGPGHKAFWLGDPDQPESDEATVRPGAFAGKMHWTTKLYQSVVRIFGIQTVKQLSCVNEKRRGFRRAVISFSLRNIRFRSCSCAQP